MLNIESSFLTENRSVLDFLNQSGQGLYIPLYQRDYSWDTDNIDQLIEDLSRGIQRIASGEVADDNKEIRFLGTLITVVEPNRDHIHPIEIQAVPSRIERVIDGQQRVSTIALMAALLTKRLIEIRKKVKNNNLLYDQVQEICDLWINQRLIKTFSFDLGRGKPKLKPKIIRGEKDYWTKENDVDVAYKSELANYLGHVIKAYDENTEIPSMTKEKNGQLLFQNSKRIEGWLKTVVSVAHMGSSNEDFPTAETILNHFSQEQIWDFKRDDLVEIIKQKDYTSIRSDSFILSELVQVLSVCHYLLDRCCFTIIQPTDEDWAFDMFQSLNATGTPLTAIETFKPTVVNTVERLGTQFKDSNSDQSFNKIEKFLSGAPSAQQKNKRTNDFLTSFFVSYDGRTMPTHFSYQRKALEYEYNNTCSSLAEKERFISDMGNYAEFYDEWIKYNGSVAFPLIDSGQDAAYVSFLIPFLKGSCHKMAITVLAKSYDAVIKKSPGAVDSFIRTVKAVAAYYFLWRSAFSNSGLDDTYRALFKNRAEISEEYIKSFFVESLKNKGIGSKESWINRARNFCSYDKTGHDIVRMALLLSFHDTIVDANAIGLIKKGRNGCANYLTPDIWNSSDLKTIEHVAPQKNEGQWDKDLYDPHTQLYQSLGNLTLLPQELNSSVGNKGFAEKLLYYKSVSVNDTEIVNNIRDEASRLKIVLNPETIDLLTEVQYHDHIAAISKMSVNDKWDKALVERRTECMLPIIWDNVSPWLFP